MNVEYVPMLATQRDLFRLPRGEGRFRAYLREIVDAETGEVRLPLAAMNPMGRDHVPAYLDALLALDADAAGAEAVADAGDFPDVEGDFRCGLCLADDVGGGWTNRYASEYAHRFDGGAMYARGWLVGLLWTADPPEARRAREEVLSAIHRVAHVRRHGPARTLRERMAQEGAVMAAAGCTTPALEADDLEYTREVIAPYLDEADVRLSLECLFGDAPGATLGLTPRGLSPRAGLALALYDARRA